MIELTLVCNSWVESEGCDEHMVFDVVSRAGIAAIARSATNVSMRSLFSALMHCDILNGFRNRFQDQIWGSVCFDGARDQEPLRNLL